MSVLNNMGIKEQKIITYYCDKCGKQFKELNNPIEVRNPIQCNNDVSVYTDIHIYHTHSYCCSNSKIICDQCILKILEQSIKNIKEKL